LIIIILSIVVNYVNVEGQRGKWNYQANIGMFVPLVL